MTLRSGDIDAGNIGGRLGGADGSVSVPTTGVLLFSANRDREWLAVVVKGANNVDFDFIGQDGTTSVGTLRLGQLGSLVLSRHGDMPWFGGLKATAIGAASDVVGIEVSRKKY
jgi:hypothetical protein